MWLKQLQLLWQLSLKFQYNWISSYNFGSFWIDTAFSWTWIGSGSDLDPDAEILDRIGSRSNAVQVDRIGSRSEKIGSDYITA